MAQINSYNGGHRVRRDMTGKLADYLGVTFSFVDGQPTVRIAMDADDRRLWYLTLDASETAKLFAGCDQVRTLKAATAS